MIISFDISKKININKFIKVISKNIDSFFIEIMYYKILLLFVYFTIIITI